MQEEDAYQLVIDFAKNNHLKHSTKDDSQHHVLLPGDAYTKTKYVIIEKSGLYFISYYSHSSRSKGKSFSGIYGEVKLNPSADFRVYQKDWIDRFMLIGKRKFNQSAVNKKLTLTSRSNKLPKDFFTLQTANKFLSINKKLAPLQILAEFDYMPIVNQLKGKMLIGLESNRWLYKTEELNLMFGEGHEFLQSLINRAKSNSWSY